MVLSRGPFLNLDRPGQRLESGGGFQTSEGVRKLKQGRCDGPSQAPMGLAAESLAPGACQPAPCLQADVHLDLISFTRWCRDLSRSPPPQAEQKLF